MCSNEKPSRVRTSCTAAAGGGIREGRRKLGCGSSTAKEPVQVLQRLPWKLKRKPLGLSVQPPQELHCCGSVMMSFPSVNSNQRHIKVGGMMGRFRAVGVVVSERRLTERA